MLTAIAQAFYRLIPGNPILRRVVDAGGRRKRDLFIRCGYLGLLVLLVLLMLFESAGSLDRADLTELSKRSGDIFWWMSHAQLALVALLAPIFTAGAITQEKDSQTYDILLATPLTNGQIVLGSLLSRLFFVIALLVSGIPIFSITQIFGGVAIASIVQSFAIAAATAFVCGALAMAIAVFKVGTRRTIFSFYLFIMIYLAVPLAIEAMGLLRVPGSRPGSHISWFSGINPFLALRVIFNDGKYVPPEMGQAEIAGYSHTIQWYLSSPASFYVTFMFALSFVLVVPSVLLLRRLAQSTSTIRSWILQKLHLSTGDKTRRVRRVWNNPIAWREARTKASAARAMFLRYSFMLLGVAAAVVLVAMYATRVPADKFIANDGFDPANHALHIYDSGKMRTVYGPQNVTTSSVHLRINGNDVDWEDLRPRMVISSYKASKDGLLESLDITGSQSRLTAETTRRFLLGAVLVEFAVILLIVTQSAASTVTREKEDGTLDLLLSTPITSRYYIWGKLRGLVAFILPLVAVPLISLLLFVVHDLFLQATDPAGVAWIVFPESLIVLPGVMIMVSAFAAILGMQMSLRCKTTVMAIMTSVGIAGAVCFGLGACGYSALNNKDFGQAGLIIGSLSPFTLASTMIDPQEMASSVFGPGHQADEAGARVLMALGGWIVTAIYGFIVWNMYKSMVRNFDMTIRKQAT